MKTFLAEHNGMYIGGYSIVTAGSKKAAEKLIKELLVGNKLKIENIKLTEVNTVKRNAVLISNGDY